MKPQTFLLLSGLTAGVMAAAGYAVLTRKAGEAPVMVSAPLVPGLAGQLDQLVALTVSSGDHRVTIARPAPTSDQWTIAEKFGYRVDPVLLRTAVQALAEATTLEPRTANPEQYGKLKVDDAEGVHMALRSADGRAWPVLIIGKSASTAAGQAGSYYARRAGEPGSWLVAGEAPTAATEPLGWLDRRLPTMARDRVASVTLQRPGQPALTVSRSDPGQASFTIAGLPAGAKPDQTKIDELPDTIAYLTLEDVAAAPAGGEEPAIAGTALFRSFDGEQLTITLRPFGGQLWASFASAHDPVKGEAPAAKPTGDSTGGYDGWRYRLSETTLKTLTSRAEDFVAQPEAQPEK